MSHQNSGQPDSSFQPKGNRPADNARQATPGSALSGEQFLGNDGAADFLGLGDEVAPTTPAELMQPEVAPAAFEPAPEEAPYEESADLAEEGEGYEDSEEEYEDEYGEEDGVHSSWVEESSAVPAKSMLPKILVAMVLGMGGMTAVFVMQQSGEEPGAATPLTPDMNRTPGYRDMVIETPPPANSSTGRVPVTSGPGTPGNAELVARAEQPAGNRGARTPRNTPGGTPEGAAVAIEPVVSSAEPAAEPGAGSGGEPSTDLALAAAGDGAAPDEGPSAVEPESEAGLEGLAERTTATSESAPVTEVAVSETAALIPIWQRVGETPPPGATAFAEPEVTSTLVVAGNDTGDDGVEASSFWDDFYTTTPTETEPALDESAPEDVELAAAEPVEPVTDGSLDESVELAAGEPVEPVTDGSLDESVELAAAEPVETVTDESVEQAVTELVEAIGGASVELTAAESAEDAGEDVGELVKTLVSAQPPEMEQSGFFGPAMPAGLTPSEPVAQVGEEPIESNTRVRRINTSQVVEPDRSGPRRATEAELKGVWLEVEVPPMHAISLEKKILTPQVGQVRVILEGNEIFQGRLYAMGEGRVWINSENFGQMGLDGARVNKIVRIVADDDSPQPGQEGSQDLGGLESVRVKTPGGILIGKVIARDELRTTLVTTDGTRVTLSSDEVEFLDEAPGVRLKRAEVEKTGSEPEKDAEKTTDEASEEAP